MLLGLTAVVYMISVNVFLIYFLFRAFTRSTTEKNLTSPKTNVFETCNPIYVFVFLLQSTDK